MNYNIKMLLHVCVNDKNKQYNILRMIYNTLKEASLHNENFYF